MEIDGYLRGFARFGRIVTPHHIAEVIPVGFLLGVTVIGRAIGWTHRFDHLPGIGLALHVDRGIFLASIDCNLVKAVKIIRAVGCCIVGRLNTLRRELLGCGHYWGCCACAQCQKNGQKIPYVFHPESPEVRRYRKLNASWVLIVKPKPDAALAY